MCSTGTSSPSCQSASPLIIPKCTRPVLPKSSTYLATIFQSPYRLFPRNRPRRAWRSGWSTLLILWVRWQLPSEWAMVKWSWARRGTCKPFCSTTTTWRAGTSGWMAKIWESTLSTTSVMITSFPTSPASSLMESRSTSSSTLSARPLIRWQRKTRSTSASTKITARSCSRVHWPIFPSWHWSVETTSSK